VSARRGKVLVVDDEDDIVLALHRVLYQDNHRYDVLLARSAEIAQEILERDRIDVMVTDVHLPAQSGMDLVGWVAARAPQTRVIVMTAHDIARIKDRAHAFGCLRLVRKPFDVHEMRAAVLRALSLRDTFTGDLSELSCVDVIQMLCLAKKTAALRLSEGESAGVVHIDAGEIVHAVWGDTVGTEAFYRVLGVRNGLFSTAPLPPDVERTLEGDWQHLLIEGLRRLDEAGAADRPSLRPAPPTPRDGVAAFRSDAPPPQAASPEGGVTFGRSTLGSMLGDAAGAPGSGRRAPEVSRLVDDGFRALRAGRREEAKRAWEAALAIDPGNRMVELNLRKLGA